MIDVEDMPKTTDQLTREHIVRITLERAALAVERHNGNEAYKRAWKAAAKIIRGMKP